MAVITWLTAIDLETSGNYQKMQQRYGDRLRRHITKVSTRPDWNELEQAPESFPEHIKSRITCYPEAQHKYAREGQCTFTIACNNIMNRVSTAVRDIVLTMPPGNNVLCTADPDLGLADKREIEGSHGIKALEALEELLRRVEQTGTLREPLIGRFDSTPSYNGATIYAVDRESNVLWFQQKPSNQPNVLSDWIGPRNQPF
jgi:hypothetical protein